MNDVHRRLVAQQGSAPVRREPSMRGNRRADAVAAYASAAGAERAVSQLVGFGYDETQVAIAPREFEVVDRRRLRRRLGVGLRRGAVGGGIAALLFEIQRHIGMTTIVGSVLPVVVGGIAAGLVAGLLVAAVLHLRARVVTFDHAPREIAPTRFEVVVDETPERARHRLAKWWDPTAPPAGWQQPA